MTMAIDSPPAVYRSIEEFDPARACFRYWSAWRREDPSVSQFWSRVKELQAAIAERNKILFDDARERLKRTVELQFDWDSYGAEAPNGTARSLATTVLTRLEAVGLPPDRLLPSAEGGIALSIISETGRAEIEIYNTGEIAAVAYSGDRTPEAWDVDSQEAAIDSVLSQIRVHLSD